MSAATINPGTVTCAAAGTKPPDTASTTGAPAATSTKKNVPTNSLRIRRPSRRGSSKSSSR